MPVTVTAPLASRRFVHLLKHFGDGINHYFEERGSDCTSRPAIVGCRERIGSETVADFFFKPLNDREDSWGKLRKEIVNTP